MKEVIIQVRIDSEDFELNTTLEMIESFDGVDLDEKAKNYIIKTLKIGAIYGDDGKIINQRVNHGC